MSGGHYSYKYIAVQEAAEQINDEIKIEGKEGEVYCGSISPKEQIPDRKKIQAILARIANAMKALEWYDSSDDNDWNAVVIAFKKILEPPQP